MRISDNILIQNAEIYRRLRNTLFKFCLANISDFDFDKNACNDFSEIDCLVLTKLAANIDHINLCYEQYDLMTIIRIINSHVIELSGWYFDIIKDALYCEQQNSLRRRTIQTVLFHVLHSYLILLTPIIPHTCEEVYSFIKISHKGPSIILEK
ncbi:hypothetical protein FACS1894218_2770 [Bacilli bacterium]|nr:hypothetical protein FACS1894218_2770 [Bacilli bacterium]